jgi:hypothetical protein
VNRNNVKARCRAFAFALRYGWMFAHLTLMESGLKTEKSLDEHVLVLGLAVTKAYFLYAEEVLGLADARRWLELEAKAMDPVLSEREAGTLAALRNRLDAGAEVPESPGLDEPFRLDRGSRHERRMSAWLARVCLCLEQARIALKLTLAETSVLDRLYALEEVALTYLVGQLPGPLAHHMSDVATVVMANTRKRARNLFAAGGEDSWIHSFERAENWFALEVGHLVGRLDRADAEELEMLRRQLASVAASSSSSNNEDDLPF